MAAVFAPRRAKKIFKLEHLSLKYPVAGAILWQRLALVKVSIA